MLGDDPNLVLSRVLAALTIKEGSMRTSHVGVIVVLLVGALAFVQRSSGIGFCNQKCEPVLKWQDSMTSAGDCFWVKDQETATCVDDALWTDSGMDKDCANKAMSPTVTIRVGGVCDNCCANGGLPRKCLSRVGGGSVDTLRFIMECVAK